MRHILPLSVAVFTICLFAGCETPGHALAKSAVDQIQSGKTTRADVEKTFGEPKQMTKSQSGKALYYYRRFYGPSAQQSAFSDESHLLVLTVLFDPAGIVEKHLYSHTNPNVSDRMLSVGRKLGKEELGRIVPQKTTLAELGSWFGPHWSEELTLSGQRLVVWLYGDAFNVIGNVNVQALEVIVDDVGTVSDFRVTKRDTVN
jgi:outer membrane protein assembly factor BamE (lipoprotein component of BamABCDE complex)